MDTETPLQQNDNTTIGKIASAAGIITGITGGVITAGVINIFILSLGTPLLGPKITVLLNLTAGLYASYKSIKGSINISEKYVTPVVKNILQSSVNYFAKSKSVQQDMLLPMKVPDVNNQLPVQKEPDHLPMKIVDNELQPSVSKMQKVSETAKSSPRKKSDSNKSSAKLEKNSGKSEELKKPKIESKKTSNKSKDQNTPARG